ncbi:MAG: DNA alkylation repair protein [Candidatus Micrarchaeota archaeon]
MTSQILLEIRSELNKNADPKIKASSKKFFKEKITCYGMKNAVVNKIAREYWPKAKLLGKNKVFELCEELFASDYCEEAFIACNWVPRFAKEFEENDLKTFEKWINAYVNNWAKCDTFCNHSVGELIEKYPKLVVELKKWAKSKNLWVRRAAAVSLIIPAKKGLFLREAFEISDLLLLDEEDLVQKGYGWLLKEESRKHECEVFNYVMKNKARMPRTALRYAIELMSSETRKKAMNKYVQL